MNVRRLRTPFASTLLMVLIVPILVACGGAATPSATSAPAATTAAAAAPTAAPVATTAATVAPAATTETAATAAPVATTEVAMTPEASATTSTTGSSGGNILRTASGSFPDSLDPQKSSFANEIAIEELNYEGLMRFDKDLKTVPAAAEKFEFNKDATVYTFTLRSGLKYSDGSPLTAQDFADAAYRSLDPNSPGDYQATLVMIKGADEIINTVVPTDTAKLPELRKALGIRVLDERTIAFDLTQPTPYFPTLMAVWVMYPAKDSLVKAGGENWWEDAKNQIGNGPFQLTTIDKGNNLIEFKANENYWAGRPKIDGVSVRIIDDLSVALQAYKNNEIDIFTPDPNDVETLKADAELGPQYKEYAGSCTTTFSMNLTKPPFDNKKVRQALATGFDREAYIHDALKDTAISTLTWIPPGYPGYDANEKRFSFDPEAAKKLLAEAGFPDGKGLPEIKYSYSSSNPANQTRAEYLQQLLKKDINVDITLDPVDSKALVRMRKSKDTYPQITGGGWCADYPDQQDWLSIYWHSRSPFAQNIGYKNAEADKLMDAADIEVDPAKRADLYDQAQKLIIDDQGEIPTRNSKNYYMIRPTIKGLDFTPQDTDLPGLITGLLNVTIEK